MLTTGGSVPGGGVKGQARRLMRCKETLKTGICRKWVVLTRNDVGVGDTGQPLEAVALLVFARHLDEEALRGGASLWQAPQTVLPQVRGQGNRDGAQGPS